MDFSYGTAKNVSNGRFSGLASRLVIQTRRFCPFVWWAIQFIRFCCDVLDVPIRPFEEAETLAAKLLLL